MAIDEKHKARIKKIMFFISKFLSEEIFLVSNSQSRIKTFAAFGFVYAKSLLETNSPGLNKKS